MLVGRHGQETPSSSRAIEVVTVVSHVFKSRSVQIGDVLVHFDRDGYASFPVGSIEVLCRWMELQPGRVSLVQEPEDTADTVQVLPESMPVLAVEEKEELLKEVAELSSSLVPSNETDAPKPKKKRGRPKRK